MKDKTKDQLIHELTALRQRIAELEELETQHNKVEQALRDCEESFKAIAENVAYGVAIVMSEGTHVYVNRSVTEITGYSIDELLHMNIQDLLLQDESDRLMQVFRKRLTGEPVPSRYETIIIRKNGTRIPVEITVALATWQGKPANIVFSHNITERKQAEKTLKASEERFRMLVETCPDAIFSIDLEGRILSVNKATCDKMGYSKEDLLAMSIKDLTPPSYIPQFRTRVNRLLKGEVLHDLSEYEVIDKAGQRLWIEAASAPLRMGNEIFGFLSIARDITKRKQMEKTLRQSEGRLLQIIQGSSVPTFVIDKSHLITHWNAACESLTGIGAHEVIGTHKHWKAFYSSQRPALADLIVDNVSEKEIAEFYSGKSRRSKLIGGAYEAEDFFPHLGEKERWLYFTAAPLRDAEGNIIGAIETLQDITRRKQAEQALRESEEITRVLFSISNAVNTTINLDELYRFIHASLSQIIDLRNFYISLYERQAQTITFPYAVDEVDESVFNTLILQDIESSALTGRVLRAGRPLLIKKEEMLTQVRDQGEKVFDNMPEVWLGVPLKVKSEVIGVMATQSYTDPNRYSKRDLDILLSVSDQVALAIERKQAEGALRRSEEEAKRLAQENATMAEIGRIISSTLNIEKVYELFAEEVRKVIPFDRIAINIIYSERDAYASAYIAGKDVAGHRPGDIVPLAGSLTEEIVRTRSSMFIQTDDRDEVVSRFPGLLPNFQAGLRSLIAVPLISKEQVIGVLHVQSAKPNTYTERDLRLAERVGSQIAGAIANAQLFVERKRAEEALQREKQAVERLAEEREIVAKIGRIISSTLEIDKVYESFATEVRKVIPFDRMAINLIYPERDAYVAAYIEGKDVAGYRPEDVDPLAGSLTGEIVRTRSSMLIQEEDRDEVTSRFPALLPFFHVGFRSFISVSLISKDQVIGVLHIFSIKSKPYTEADKNLAESIGNQIAGAIANAQLFVERKRTEEALRESEEITRVLFSISNAINTTINLDELYRFIHASLSQIIDLRNFYISLYERQTQTITFPYAVDEVDEDVFHTLLTLQDIESSALTGRVLMTGRPLLIKKEEMLTQVREQGEKVFGNMPEVWLGVPLKVKNEVIGVMATQSYTDPNRYNKRDLDILLSVSDQVALAIERKQAEEALRRSEEEARRLAQENATMAEIGRIISSSLNINEVYERFAEEVSKLIQFDNIVINIINPKEDTVTISYVAGIDAIGHRAGDTIPLAGTATGECMRTRSSLLIQTESIAEATRRFPGLLPNLMAGLRSMIFVPLISKDQVIGVLSLRATKPNAYTEEDLRLAERVGNQIVDAIANAQLFVERKRAEEALRESEEITRVLFSISNAINTTINLDELYRFIHASLSQVIDLRNFYISLYDHQTQTITFPYAADEMDVNMFQTRTLQDIESSALTGRVLMTGRPLLIRKEELLTQVRDQGKRVFGNMPEVWLGVPLKVKNEVIGVMATQSYTDSNHYSKRDLDILLSVSDQVALAIERKQAEEALRESEERYRALFESSKDAVYITTREGKFIDANQSLVDLFGYTREELEKVDARETYVNPDDRLRFQQVIEEKGSVRDFEMRLLKKDGREMDCLVTATLRRDNDGSILGYHGVIRDITERKRTEEELAYMATHDLLTRLPNRMLFNDRLSVAMAQAQRAHKKLAVMFLDLDRFKEVNDTLGHNVGDRLLYAIGNRLKELLRKIDSVARMGGDEFLLLLPDIDCVKDAISIAQKVLEGLQKPFVVEGHEISITTSIGIAIYPDDGEDVETLVSRADKAMYGAKQRGHDTYQPYLQTIDGEASE